MKCPYCRKPVVGLKDIVIIVGEGPAHTSCHRKHLKALPFKNTMLEVNQLSTETLLRNKSLIEGELEKRNDSLTAVK